MPGNFALLDFFKTDSVVLSLVLIINSSSLLLYCNNISWILAVVNLTLIDLPGLTKVAVGELSAIPIE